MRTLPILPAPARLDRLRREYDVAPGAAVDARGLAEALRREIRGDVRFDDGTRALYATDASNYRQPPIGVVLPRDETDVIAAVEIARRFDAPLLPRGAGTSLAGQACNVALVLDFSRYMNAVLEVDPARRLARVQPGCILDRLRDQTEKFGLTFGPDPATHSRCTLGGMLGNNSCGAHSLVSRNAGFGLRTSDNTHRLRILTYAGEILDVGPQSERHAAAHTKPNAAPETPSPQPQPTTYHAALHDLAHRHADEIRTRFANLPRRVSGYNLDDLLLENNFHLARALVGAEGTCVTVLEATLHLVPSPAARVLLVLGYPDVFTAGEHVAEILEHQPTALECFDQLLTSWIRTAGGQEAGLSLLPPGGGYALVEFGGETIAEASARAQRLADAAKRTAAAPSARLFTDSREQLLIWRLRESALGTASFLPGKPDSWEGWEDSAVAPERIGAYLRAFDRLLRKYNFQTAMYGHLGQGCVHVRIPFDFYSEAGLRTYRAFMDEASDLAVSFGGSLSGEHGDGQSRAEFLHKQFGPQLMQAFREFKAIWDPRNRMNPGKVVDPYAITDNLRLGPDYPAPPPPTHFNYPRDRGDFRRAALRCVGVGICRRESGGTMCPSYMVTREERHSTRGRARLLWEMLNGDIIRDGWNSTEVREALDLCLACKACKSECPVSVDMATYKAEFLAHHYARRLRPRAAYAFGWIHRWARLAVRAPRLANLLARSRVGKLLAGVAPQRTPPRFARETFRAWFRRTELRNMLGPPVLLFPDTFTNHFRPEIARAAAEVLEYAGFRVTLPRADVCCGRPLYDFGFLDEAKRRLQHLLQVLAPEIAAGVPLVVLEPSCAAVFRDELLNLFPNEPLAAQLSKQVYLLADFLERFAPHAEFHLSGPALIHTHCHQKSLFADSAEERFLRRAGLEITAPDAGCCGMAGAFGFQREHFDVSINCGERILLPAVRAASPETLIITSGFSCHEQITHATPRTPLHLAQVLQMALVNSDYDTLTHDL